MMQKWPPTANNDNQIRGFLSCVFDPSGSEILASICVSNESSSGPAILDEDCCPLLFQTPIMAALFDVWKGAAGVLRGMWPTPLVSPQATIKMARVQEGKWTMQIPKYERNCPSLCGLCVSLFESRYTSMWLFIHICECQAMCVCVCVCVCVFVCHTGIPPRIHIFPMCRALSLKSPPIVPKAQRLPIPRIPTLLGLSAALLYSSPS